ncbi:ParA family protein [Flexithrix dorotheae]|uniref:ParA family protein n=1 Tax=Flexithrix dorotheae TaxID=70993 RepID=UPI0003706DE7|nr:ParA family protein [Flexithrix dorotheae]
MSAKVISVANEKGGVAKTTSAAAIGSVLSRMGHTIILVDLDPQSDLTISLGVEPKERNIHDCIFEHRKLKAWPINENLVLVGGSPELTPIDFLDNLKKDEEYQYENPRMIIKHLLEQAKEKCDYIILDCPPNLEIITQNALLASDYVLIPSEAHSFSINGVENIIDQISRFKKKANPDLEALGIFLTRYRTNTRSHEDLVEYFNKNHPDIFLKTYIHENITIQEATHSGRELEEHDIFKKKKSMIKKKEPFKGLQDYRLLVNEILNRI